ncbi:MAG: glutamyl-tRNA reductase [Candidatus Eisenbacteria bacterium]
MAHVVVVGLSHHTAPLEVREKIALTPDELPAALAAVRALEGVREAALLSTCNRSEIVAVTDTYHGGRAVLEDALHALARARGKGVLPDEYLYRFEGPAAARHLFRVAGSIDSMVVGEPQILGQVKDAWRAAADGKTLGPVLDRLFRHAIEVGKRVRSETDIGAYAVSISFAAVELAKKIFGPLAGREVLIVGAGETGELTMRHLKSAGASVLWVANRTPDAAEALATALGGRAIGLTELSAALAAVDVVISSTGAAEPVIRRALVERAMKERKGRPLFLVDIAVPRDVEPACGQVYNVFLYDLDDLAKVVAGNRDRREAEAELAGTIIADEVVRFTEWFESRDAVPTIVALKEKVDALRDVETGRVLRRLEHLSERDKALVAQYGEALANKILHGPLSQIRHVGAGERGVALAGALRYLFRLDESSAGETTTKNAAEGGEGEEESAPPRNRT